LLGASTLPFMYNVWKTWRTAPLVSVDDPWGFGGSLEWATSCPPPRHNFVTIPCIRSERPAFDLHHPEVAVSDAPTADKGVLDHLLGEPDVKQEGTGTTSRSTGSGSSHQRQRQQRQQSKPQPRCTGVRPRGKQLVRH
jgi:cytochrome c oxidase subunit 1